MSFALGIIIDGWPIEDKHAKLMAGYCMGLDNNEISGIVLMRTSTLRNFASELYGRFSTGKSPQSLARKAGWMGFDDFGNFEGKPVFDSMELMRLASIAPRFLHEKR